MRGRVRMVGPSPVVALAPNPEPQPGTPNPNPTQAARRCGGRTRPCTASPRCSVSPYSAGVRPTQTWLCRAWQNQHEGLFYRFIAKAVKSPMIRKFAGPWYYEYGRIKLSPESGIAVLRLGDRGVPQLASLRRRSSLIKSVLVKTFHSHGALRGTPLYSN